MWNSQSVPASARRSGATDDGGKIHKPWYYNIIWKYKRWILDAIKIENK